MPRKRAVITTTWVVPVRDEFSGYIVVEAVDVADALSKVGEAQLEPGAELINWEATGTPKEER